MDTNVLFEEIKGDYNDVASALEEAKLTTDADLQLLTQADLSELLPGLKNVKKRKLISDIIHKQKPIDVLVQKLRDFIPDEYLCDALSPNGVMVGYLNVLKDLKSQLNNVQDFLDAHIKLLEEPSNSQPPQDQEKGSSSSTSHGSGSMKRRNSQTSNSSQTAGGRGSSRGRSKNLVSFYRGHTQKTQAKVTYKKEVSGKTFDADLQLLDKVKASTGEPDLILVEQEDSQVVIVFCPVVSRVMTDAETALKTVADRKHVILVLMHHTYAVKAVPPVNLGDNVVLCVNVFYHETMHGLLQCQENNGAIADIRQELMRHSVETTENVSEKAENESKSWFSISWK